MIDPVQYATDSTIQCTYCEAEFTVYTDDSEAMISFCPFCGSELDDEDDEDDEDNALIDDEDGYYD